MYQIKYECGFEIQTLAGSNVCRVEKSTASENTTRFRGTMEECEKWLRERGIRPLHRSRGEEDT